MVVTDESHMKRVEQQAEEVSSVFPVLVDSGLSRHPHLRVEKLVQVSPGWMLQLGQLSLHNLVLPANNHQPEHFLNFPYIMKAHVQEVVLAVSADVYAIIFLKVVAAQKMMRKSGAIG